MKTKQRTVIFSDFDGTISTKDVGNRLFHHFSGGRSEEIVAKWQAGTITARECLLAEAALIRLTETELSEYLLQFELDPGFAGFEKLCRSNGVELIILSDGLSLYIRHILARHGFEYLKVLANEAEFAGDQLKVSFPYDLGKCGSCGNCKGDRIEEYLDSQADDPFTVFIGDGLSDRCGAQKVDQLFAINELAKYCQERSIEYNSFSSFFDISKQLLAENRLAQDDETLEERTE